MLGRTPCPRKHRSPRMVKTFLSFGVNGPRTREDNNRLVIVLEEPSLLGKVLWKVGTQPSRECFMKGNHSYEDKHQGR